VLVSVLLARRRWSHGDDATKWPRCQARQGLQGLWDDMRCGMAKDLATMLPAKHESTERMRRKMVVFSEEQAASGVAAISSRADVSRLAFPSIANACLGGRSGAAREQRSSVWRWRRWRRWCCGLLLDGRSSAGSALSALRFTAGSSRGEAVPGVMSSVLAVLACEWSAAPVRTRLGVLFWAPGAWTLALWFARSHLHHGLTPSRHSQRTFPSTNPPSHPGGSGSANDRPCAPSQLVTTLSSSANLRTECVVATAKRPTTTADSDSPSTAVNCRPARVPAPPRPHASCSPIRPFSARAAFPGIGASPA
jgi:hypothetical protein